MGQSSSVVLFGAPGFTVTGVDENAAEVVLRVELTDTVIDRHTVKQGETVTEHATPEEAMLAANEHLGAADIRTTAPVLRMVTALENRAGAAPESGPSAAVNFAAACPGSGDAGARVSGWWAAA